VIESERHIESIAEEAMGDQVELSNHRFEENEVSISGDFDEEAFVERFCDNEMNRCNRMLRKFIVKVLNFDFEVTRNLMKGSEGVGIISAEMFAALAEVHIANAPSAEMGDHDIVGGDVIIDAFGE
jgi:hypothetical protein